ncbi:MAG: chemotaxis protein CheW [Rhodospirillales bacterium]
MAASRGLDWERVHERLRSIDAGLMQGTNSDLDTFRPLLTARSQQLAARIRNRDTPTEMLPVLEFALGRGWYGIALRAVAAVVPWRKPGHVPNGPSGLLGMVNAKGEAWLIYDLRRLFGHDGETKDANRLILLRHNQVHVGICVSETGRVIKVDESALGSMSDDHADRDSMMMAGVTKDGVVIVDDSKLLGHRAIIEEN